MSKILIIEDDLVFARALKNWLEKEHFQVEYATNATRARRMITDNGDADLILSDMRLPDGDGVEMLEWLNKRDSRIPFVVMTQYAEVQSAVKAMKLGAVDYLPKPFDMGELIARVRAMLRRREEFHPDLIRFGDLTLNMQSGEIGVGDMSFVLPKQEYRLMEQLVLNKTMYLSTEDLLVKAWGYNAETDINSVWLYISYLRKRLSAMNSKVEIVSKRNVGYKLEYRP